MLNYFYHIKGEIIKKKIISKTLCFVFALIVAFSIDMPSFAKNPIVTEQKSITYTIHSAIIPDPITQAETLIKANYIRAKNKGKKPFSHSKQVGGSLPTEGKAYSSKDLYDKDGNLKQRRYYDKNGNADVDIDYRHGGNGKEPFPHRHKWSNGKRGKAYW